MRHLSILKPFFLLYIFIEIFTYCKRALCKLLYHLGTFNDYSFTTTPIVYSFVCFIALCMSENSAV